MDQNETILTVQELNRYLKELIEGATLLQDIWIRGEISNFTHHSRGHMYFTIKDENAVLKVVMFAGNNRYLKFIPKNGSKVLVRGNVTVYESGGNYQLVAREMQPDGIGNLYLAYEQLKQRLQEEGLFAQERKKPLPSYPRVIGVVTSPTGAAVRDIVTTIRRRFPVARIFVLPVVVQGPHAPRSICDAIGQMNRSDIVDVMIVGRGGGSIEELWAFNDEQVAKAIHLSQIPVISAVGHETDFTIADFVADVRAATPTAAAELAVPHILETRQKISWLESKLQTQLLQHLEQVQNRWKRANRSLSLRHPRKQVESANQSLDRLVDRMSLAVFRCHRMKRVETNHATQRLQMRNPAAQIKQYQERVEQTQEDLQKQLKTIINKKRSQWMVTMARLDGLSPLKIMSRGYSLVYKDNEMVKSVHQLDPGDAIKVKLVDGSIDCSIWGIEERKQ